jgi:hypothetical protein
MNIQQICYKYKISESYLNSKEDALLVIANSLQELYTQVNTNSNKQASLDNIKKLVEFAKDVKNSGV